MGSAHSRAPFHIRSRTSPQADDNLGTSPLGCGSPNPTLCDPCGSNSLRPSLGTRTHYAERLLTLGCRRLWHILYLTWFVVHLSSMGCVFPVGRHLEFGYGHMLQPIAFLAFRAVHGRISSRRSIGPMKMGKACLPTIRLRFGTKTAFDAFAYPLQYGRGIAHGLIEHHELDPAIAFV